MAGGACPGALAGGALAGGACFGACPGALAGGGACVQLSRAAASANDASSGDWAGPPLPLGSNAADTSAFLALIVERWID